MNPTLIINLFYASIVTVTLFLLSMFFEETFLSDVKTSKGKHYDEQRDLIQRQYVLIFKTTDGDFKRASVTMEEYYEYMNDEEVLILETTGRISKHVYKTYLGEIKHPVENS